MYESSIHLLSNKDISILSQVPADWIIPSVGCWAETLCAVSVVSRNAIKEGQVRLYPLPKASDQFLRPSGLRSDEIGKLQS